MTQLASSLTGPTGTGAETGTETGNARPTRAPWTVKVLAAIVLLLALVTSYGSIYFTFYFGDPPPGIGSWAFVAVFFTINAVAAVSALALLRGSRTGWRVLVGYGVLGILWCIAKLVFWQETEALIFGAGNVVALLLLAALRTRRHLV